MVEPNQQEAPPFLRLMPMITGHWVAASLYATVRLNVADHLQAGPRTSEELARSVGAHGPSLYRVMRALASIGVFEESAGRRFTLTALGELLASDHPHSMRSIVLFQGAPPHWKGWGNFLYSVQTGKPAFAQANGKGFFEYCASDPQFSEAFNGAMTSFSAFATEAVLDAYDFSGIRKLIDVGGGHGYFLARILERYPQIKGVIYDLPHVVAGAQIPITQAGIADRCELIGGSFFESVPPADTYLAKHIIHDWDDEHARTILANMRKAMQGRGKVLLVENVIADVKADPSVMIDLEMLHATVGGRERTQSEFAELFQSAGLKLERTVKTKAQSCVLEAVPVD